MQYAAFYPSPLGNLTMTADETGLTGLWLPAQNSSRPETLPEAPELPVFLETRRWLDAYFSGRKPDFLPPLHLIGSDFQMAVWEILLTIPYGKTTTYGDIAREIAARQGKSRMSAQAVGGAVGSNPVSILVPCHRVVGKSGSLTGYAGGLPKKVFLLQLEQVDMTRFFLPKK